MIFSNDCVGMLRSIPVNMLDRFIDAVDGSYRNDGCKILGGPVLLRCSDTGNVGSL